MDAPARGRLPRGQQRRPGPCLRRERQHAGADGDRHLRHQLGRGACESRRPADARDVAARLGHRGGIDLGRRHGTRRGVRRAQWPAHLPDRRPVGMDAGLAARRSRGAPPGTDPAQPGHQAQLLNAARPAGSVIAGGPGLVGEVREHAVHAEAEELAVLGRRIALVIGGEPLGLAAERVGMHEQAGRMGVGHHAGGRHHDAVALVDDAVAVEVVRLAVVVGVLQPGRDQVGLPGADAVRIGLHLAQPLGREQAGESAAVAGHREIIGFVVGRREVDAAVGLDVVAVHELHEAHMGLRAQVLEVGHLEGLHHDRRGRLGVAVLRERVEQPVFELQVQVGVVGGVLGLDIDAHGAACLRALGTREVQYLRERGDLEAAVEGLVAIGQRLDGAQGLDLGQREIGGEPPLLLHAVHHPAGLAVRELGTLRHVGRAGDVGLVAGDEHAVPGRHQVRLDEVGAQLDAAAVAFERMVGQVPGGAAVADHQGLGAVEGGMDAAAIATAGGQGRACGGSQGQPAGEHQGGGRAARDSLRRHWSLLPCEWTVCARAHSVGAA